MRKHWMYLLASALLLALFVTTGALAAGEGQPLTGGERNPSNNQSQELQAETEIIASTDTYGTRQSNKSNNGGGAIYGCRAAPGGTPANNEPCIRANNLNRGLAFEFETDGTLTGTITSRAPGDGSKPFTTNATGVATGLNADRVDSLDAEQIVERASGPFAIVNAQGETVTNSRGVKASNRADEGVYNVVFSGNLSACAFNATQSGDVATDNLGAAAVEVGAFDQAQDQTTVQVGTREGEGATGGNDLADRGFHLTATC